MYVKNVRGQAGYFTLSVDSFQGQERDIIAITLTRSNPQGEIGFLSDIRRMNMGMTRARRKLLLVGDSSTLCSHPFFLELLAYGMGVGATGQCVRWANRLDSEMAIAAKRARAFVLNLLDWYHDTLTGATAKVHGLPVATFNVADFRVLGFDVLNPFGPVNWSY